MLEGHGAAVYRVYSLDLQVHDRDGLRTQKGERVTDRDDDRLGGRREFLMGLGAVSLLGASGCLLEMGTELEGLSQGLTEQELRARLRFRHGVASGDPLRDRVVLWTRVTPDAPSEVEVDWLVALDPALTRIVAEGRATTGAAVDYTIKVDPILPYPGTTYYYRFSALGGYSPVGRTRTAPEKTDQVRFAVASCSSVWSGYMNGYDRIADRNDLDLVIHCGDYIYDVPDEDERRHMPSQPVDAELPRGLDGMRRRYAYYRLDPFLRGAHQQHPFSILWDNHDLTLDGSVSDAVRAYHEWTPTRTPEPSRRDRIYRRLRFGSLVDLMLLDTRRIGRNQPIDPTRPVDGTSNRSILGNEQLAWLREELSIEPAHTRVFASQVLMAPFGVFGRTLMNNAWDGYPEDRMRFLRLLRELGQRNNVVVSGDAHMSFASQLAVDGAPVAVELLPTSITRGNIDDQVRGVFGAIASGGAGSLIPLFNPHMVYTETSKHGYGIVDITSERTVGEIWYTPIDVRTEQESLGAQLRSEQGRDLWERVSAPSATRGPIQAEPSPDETPVFVRSAAYGGAGGSVFDDQLSVPPLARIRRLGLRSGDRLDRVELMLDDGTRFSHGGSGGGASSLELSPTDALVRIELSLGRKSGNTRVFSIRLTTAEGRTLAGGKPTRDLRVIEAPLGFHIVGLHGRAGTEVDALGAIFAPRV